MAEGDTDEGTDFEVVALCPLHEAWQVHMT